jgi:hypothetical protein
VLRKDRFDDREMDFYEALYTQSQAQFGAYVESGTVLHNYAHIFDLLIRLRQVSALFRRLPSWRWISHHIRSLVVLPMHVAAQIVRQAARYCQPASPTYCASQRRR